MTTNQPMSLPNIRVVDRVVAAYTRLDQVDRPEVWIALADRAEMLDRAAAIDRELSHPGGRHLPLAGLLVAVKDNIDVAGFPTTAGCPSFAYRPESSATAVQRLTDAGALILGKTNLDQFATGLVGTRSPYGAVRHATRPDHISGGSSSGSAVAVALGIVDIALGTDTAGSGRVPAALHGIIGLKPTRGLVSTSGVVPACRSYDCVSVFARSLGLAHHALTVLSETDDTDEGRTPPAHMRLASRRRRRVGVPLPAGLEALSAEGRAAFDRAVHRLEDRDVEVIPFDLEPFLRAGLLLYEGALVAERYEAAGALAAADASDLDSIVESIVRAAGTIPAHQLIHDRQILEGMRTESCRIFDEKVDALLIPTTTEHPTLAQVAEDPVGVNSRLGTYTTFVNLFDLCAAAIPAGTADGSPFGVSLIGPAFSDQLISDIAADFLGERRLSTFGANTVDLIVFGAHLLGQPLHRQLADLGARYVSEVRTAAGYRMLDLGGEPAKPGVVSVENGGVEIAGERWTLTDAAFARFAKRVTPPMAIGPVILADGDYVLGFQCTAHAGEGAVDISEYGGWRNFLGREAIRV